MSTYNFRTQLIEEAQKVVYLYTQIGDSIKKADNDKAVVDLNYSGVKVVKSSRFKEEDLNEKFQVPESYMKLLV